MVRLQKFLAEAGVASRRASEQIILAGRVAINGQKVSELGAKVDPAQDRVAVDGKEVRAKRKLYVALNKPRGLVCSRRDEFERPTIYELLPKEWRHLHSVGRLDYHSEGLIFLANDGEFSLRLTHPRYGVRKKYLATIAGRVDKETLGRLTQGLWDEGERVRAEKARLVSAGQAQSVVELELAEGKNREVRRLFETLGRVVKRLQRIQIGKVKLGELRPGKWRTLTETEIKSLLGEVMKTNCWLILGAILSTSLLAQQATNPPPAAPTAEAPAATLAPAPARTNVPETKAEKKKAPKKKAPKKKAAAAELKTVPLVPGPAVVVASNVNVRGQARLKSEVVTHVTKGQQVTVVEEIVNKMSGPDEPSAWAKILLPPETKAWVNTMFIQPTNKTVVPKKLNIRSGPGENYSVLGILQRGDAVKELATKGDWMQIEAPANAYAFVAAQFLKQEAPAAIAATTTAPPPTPPAMPAEPPPAPATVAEGTPIAPAPTEVPTPPIPAVTPTAPAPTEAPAMTTAPVTPPAAPAAEEPPPKRIVQREGVVRGTFSIQAPSKFALVSPETGQTIDYLYSPSRQLDLNRYKGLRIIVTGEEGLDERWGNTPVITIQRIQVLEEAPKAGS